MFVTTSIGGPDMVTKPTLSKESVVVLLKGGRLPTWHRLTPEERRGYEQEHIDSMLSVGHEHKMMRVEGFKLIGPQQPWDRFWVIEFPSMDGAEAWIEAGLEPPFAVHRYYEYHLSRRWGSGYFSTWVTRPRTPAAPPADADPHHIPPLDVDRSSVVALLFGRGLPEHDSTSAEVRGDAEHIELMKSVAREHGLMRIEAFSLIGPQPEWHRASVIEFPTLEGAEAWMEAEVQAPYGAYGRKTMLLARRWAPDYFDTWVQG